MFCGWGQELINISLNCGDVWRSRAGVTRCSREMNSSGYTITIFLKRKSQARFCVTSSPPNEAQTPVLPLCSSPHRGATPGQHLQRDVPGIKATLVSLLPRWLFEDFPHMENSTVLKSLQDKADFPSDSLQEPFLASAEPAVTEVEEVPAQEQPQSLDTKARAEVPEPGELPGTVVVPSSPAPGQLGAYKPQLSDGNALGYVAAGIYRAQPPAVAPQPEVGICPQDYSSPVPTLWDQQGGTAQVCLLEKINLVLNSSLGFPGQAGLGSIPQQRWEPPGEGPQQMLVPKELLSCLRATRESVGANPHTAWEGCPDSSWNWG
ncbi:hypothetical protein DV515_00017054 [Chloebia gouldiae]|uniref:Uncharacterized protein n=1 Tax=Chloebia gouldiae TaxID=44316 RepID=A0A3L8R9S7_CHLGU|nr:hypothetical protein DV515_00017051 [Chloebia gouldiae]RLV76363.1 hypothetical protein DV515_00017054 [Chloebia gouldiae]